MIEFAANISWLFAELPFSERPKAAAKAGFRALEFGFYRQADLNAVAAAQEEFGLEVALFYMDVPNWGRENRGYLADPALRDEFHRRFDEALEVAARLRAHKMLLPVGAASLDLKRDQQRECVVENLKYAGPLAEQAGILLTIKNLNPFDNVGYYLVYSRDAARILREVDHPHVRYLYDTYHLQMMEGHLIQTLTENYSVLGHIQIGDLPGRHEPGTGEINFVNVLRTAMNLGYSGYVGLEYKPLTTTTESLTHVWALQAQLAS